MKRFCLFVIPLVLHLALAPLPVAASGGGGGGDGLQTLKVIRQIKTLVIFFTTYFETGNVIVATEEAIHYAFWSGLEIMNLEAKIQRDKDLMEIRQQLIESRQRLKAKSAAEAPKHAANLSDEDLPGLGPD